MTTSASLELSERHVPEDEHLATARDRARQVGVTPLSQGAASTLALLVSTLQARAVVEVGTGTGVSGLTMLRAMADGGVLTSVDLEAEHQRLARDTFREAGLPPQRFRLIAGAALDVLPRLTDGGYDLVLIDGDKVEYLDYLAEAKRLVRPGGLVVIDNALWHDRVADADQRDPETTAIRETIAAVTADDSLRSSLLPVGDGLLVAQRLA
ncbi:O-methyltransferase [Aeromicrobium sp. IC_218]|nr:O-methyltransferase [Aeromicrobium sp. IC_218]